MYIVLIALIAGVGGTGLGGLFGSFFKGSSERVISFLLSITGGIMVAIVCFELLVESVDSALNELGDVGMLVSFASVILGVVLVLVLNRLIDRSTAPQVAHTADENHPHLHDAVDELVHVDHYNEHARRGDSKRDLWVAGVVIGCAIALHNVPEGMSIGASFAIKTGEAASTALMLAFLIGLHNVPEGMAVAIPLVAGGMGKVKAVLVTAASGLPLVIGALIGWWIGDVGPIGLSCSLGFASGAMLYVVFGEILPQATLMDRSRIPGILVVVGILIGMWFIYW